MSDPRTRQQRRRATRLGRAAPWCLGLGLAMAATAGPALAEAHVQSRLRERLGVDQGFAVDLDLRGLELRGLSRALPGHRGHVSATRVRVRPGFEGLTIEVDGLDGVVLRDPPKPAAPDPQPATTSAPPAKRKVEVEVEVEDPIAKLLQRVRGVPIEVVTHGSVRVDLGQGLFATASDPHLRLPGDGQIRGDVTLELGPEHAQAGLASPARPEPAPSRRQLDSAWARASLEFAAVDTDPRALEISGSVSLDRGTADPSAQAEQLADGGTAPQTSLTMLGRISPRGFELELREPEGGRATIDVTRASAKTDADRLKLDAEQLPLALLEPFVQLLGRRLGDALGERDGRLLLDETRLSGTIELGRSEGLTRARFDGVELSQLRFDSGLLAATPVVLTQVTIDGELTRERTEAGPRSGGALVLGHRGVQLEVSGQLDPAGLNINLELPSTPCQAVFDATPGMSAVLAGTELSGTLDAHVALRLDFAALERARARYLGPDAETLELEDFEAPGELRFDLPYIERCKIDRLGPGADIEGLRGPYHHRFVSAAGREQRRVLATGDENYVRIEQVPELALAFVILEDARFWRHDGFDREQIERAFWFNLLEGRVRRGASTITQQAARSLWLGIDRSVARKLAEAMLAAELERGLDKKRILEVYLNVIELGPEIHGVAEASRYHFGKEASRLDLMEALYLASLAPAPVAYSRRFSAGSIDDEWREHLRRQVRRLRIRHLISPETAEAAVAKNLQLRPHP
ncbi:Multimodular transpeptidase-transglycosylase [Enhygromyxa salina]|uniref:Multimodular transpeptidase-transglycosylase n=1 Tax=Enhygromyxa salina TaxID=215803 RepID=A0A0C2CV43_9BACT|nr:biosynthetic peptidoglycan transglycosylase [Enhygromyxa salina]KIG13455.1 Multimodular transpeptidase-transglycosylase [Enhygromyxa salina]